MTDLAERTEGSTLVEEPIPSGDHAPPDRRPPVMPAATTPWPFRAKALVAALSVAALLGGAGTIIGFTTGDDSSDAEAQYEDTIATLTGERVEALDMLADAEADVATVTAERDELLAELGVASADLTGAIGERDGLAAELAQIESQFDAAVDTASMAIGERDALAALFPMTFDASLDDVDLVGTYDLEYTEAYCEGFDTCGTVPAVDELVISETSEGYLRVAIDDIIDAGLFPVDGALDAVADSTTAVPASNGTPRVASIMVTIYAHGLTVADDGTHQIADLGASIAVRAPATDTSPAGLVLYGAQLTPQAES